MSNLCVNIFGYELNWTVSTAVLVLMLVQVALIAVALIVFVLLMVRRHSASRGRQNILVTQAAEGEKKQERTLVGITLDTVVVQREFRVGDTFNCDGLVVTARYSAEPVSETVTDFVVDAPSTDAEGKPSVTVRYREFTALYTISVLPAETVRKPVGISLDTGAVKHTFKAGEPFGCDGLVVTVNYDAEPYEETVTDYTVDAPDLAEAGSHLVAVHYGDFVATYSVEAEAAPVRTLVGIELDVSEVKADFFVGDAFDSEGLKVVGRYDAEPYEEPIADFTVDAPVLDRKGMINVAVHCGGFTQSYPVFVAEGRALVGITLDVSSVRLEYTAGETFDGSGLVVAANYDAEPYEETVTGYTVETPDLSEAGEREVVVRYEGQTASFIVTVSEPVPAEEPAPVEEPAPEPVPAEEPAPAEEPEGADGVLRYDRSFTARLIQSSDETKQWYTVLKNELLAYRKVKDRMSWKKESYHCGREAVAKFGFRGKMLCLFLALDPAEYAESRYKVEDVSANKSFEDTPCMYRIKNDMRVKRACELIAAVMERIGAERTDRIAEDYYLPYEGIRELVNRGLAKRLIVNENFEGMQKTETAAETEEVAVAAAPAPSSAPAVRAVPAEEQTELGFAEESVEGGTLRYDKSFRARVIQSDDETKRWYSAIKNELLSYGKVKDRLSWKRETYKAAGSCVAKMGYRGSTLCLYLPLNVADYEGTRYKVEDVSANKSCEDTPCMFRIKNDKRLRLAADLIAAVMESRGLVKRDRPEEDYAEPYQDIVSLISQGLVRREIKSKEEENLFNKE